MSGKPFIKSFLFSAKQCSLVYFGYDLLITEKSLTFLFFILSLDPKSTCVLFCFNTSVCEVALLNQSVGNCFLYMCFELVGNFAGGLLGSALLAQPVLGSKTVSLKDLCGLGARETSRSRPHTFSFFFLNLNFFIYPYVLEYCIVKHLGAIRKISDTQTD